MWDIFMKISDFFAQFHLSQDTLAKGAIFVLIMLGFLIANLVTSFQKHLMKKMNEEQPATTGKRHLIPGSFTPHALIFGLAAVEYDKKAIAYFDVTAVNFYSNTAFFESQESTKYCIGIMSRTAWIKISFTNLIIKNAELSVLYNNILQDLRLKILPQLEKKMINDIFVSDKPCRIGNIWLGKNGYSCKGLFSGLKEFPWDGPMFEAYSKGSKIEINLRTEGKLKLLASMSVDTPNMAILPELAIMCRDKAGGVKVKDN